MRHDDADEIRHRLTTSLEQLLDHLHPGWVQHRGKAFLTAKSPKELGSFQVDLSGPHRGRWYRFSQGVGGGTVELIGYTLFDNPHAYAEAFREARAFLGMTTETAEAGAERRQRQEKAAREARERRESEARKEQQRRARRAETAAEMWAQCCPIPGTLAERYLHGRGIPTPPMGWPDVLGFHDGLEWELGSEWEGQGKDARKVKDGPVFPCLVARVQDMGGETIAVWRVFLNPETGGKAPVSNPKVGFGPAKGGAVRIGGVGEVIGLAEGLETSLAAWTLEGYRLPVWASLSTSGMMGFEPPLEVERVRLYPDGDLPRRGPDGSILVGPGLAAAHTLRDRLVPSGIPVAVNLPPFHGDFLDVLGAVRATA
ncbi:DUF7146 domain-containing protein [Xanthobacter tagetidis]|nr:toprim domain-containing protein [Xanthobacter tagetidis]MBB6306244.1 hypothetical protein [Xanthobacter tagetidis]